MRCHCQLINWIGVGGVLLSFAAGCEPAEEVYTDYGRRNSFGQASVNGTGALADMFEQAGFRVRSWNSLSPSLERADVIVWAPDDFEPPTPEVQWWLVDWLVSGDAEQPPRVLLYVGRDYDAAPDYWQRVQSRAPPGLVNEYARQLREAKTEARANRPARLLNTEASEWFTLDPSAKKQEVKGLTGPWAEGIEVGEIAIARHTRMLPDDGFTLLADERGSSLVVEMEYGASYGQQAGRLMLIENGSFLLNAPLVNHEHRVLAGRLIDRVGPSERQVVFLESRTGGPPIRQTDPSVVPPSGLQLFAVWPLNVVLAQLTVLGIVYALMKWPIFGEPRHLTRRSTTDFADHVAALGRLLRESGDRSHAIHLLRVYRQSPRGNGSSIDTPATITRGISPNPPSSTP